MKTGVADPRHVQVRRRLEQMIRTGELREGQRIPPTNELVKNWGVNYWAIQRAMEELTAKGLVERTPGRGTFVRSIADKAVIGILIGPDLLNESAHFFRALVDGVQKEIGGQDWRCLCYDKLTYFDEAAVAETEQRLLHDIEHHRFKGLILIACGQVARKEDFLKNELPK